MSEELLIVTDGLLSREEAYLLHPSLSDWQPALNRYSKTWFESPAKMPVQWYGLLTGQSVSLLFDSRQLQGFEQLWIASPFYAQLNRDQLRVMPDGLFSWRESDSRWLCDLLNPLLMDEKMKLIFQGAAVALLSKKKLDAKPASFANLSGATLPNRHPEGVDGGRLMRLISEIQMMLKEVLINSMNGNHESRTADPRVDHLINSDAIAGDSHLGLGDSESHESPSRIDQHLLNQHGDAAVADVNGLWLWGGFDITSAHSSVDVERLPVATRNPALQSLTDGRDAKVVITEADRLAELLKADAALPKSIVLAGDRHAVMLKRSFLPKFGKNEWRAKSADPESSMTTILRGFHAT